MHQADHCSPAVTVELVVVARFDVVKVGNALSLSCRDGVLGHRGLEVVSQVGDEAHSIVKLDVKRLIVDGGPVALDQALFTVLWRLTRLGVLAEDGLSLEVLQQVHFVGVLLSK